MDVSAALDVPSFPGGAPRTLRLLVRLETWPEEGGPSRKPLSIALVIDRSSSMGGPKLESTLRSAGRLVDGLSPADRLAIVAYDDEAEVLVPPTPGTEKEVFREALRRIEPCGATNLSGGWILGAGSLLSEAGTDDVRRVLLLTDGQANRGVTDREGLVAIARQLREDGVATSCFGFGEDFNEGDLSAIAAEGGGRFYYIRGAEDTSSAFQEEFGELTRVTGQGLEVIVTGGEGASGVRFLGPLRSRCRERSATASLGDVLERDMRRVVACLSVPAAWPTGERDLATVEVRYMAVRGKVGLRRHVLPVRATVLQAGAAAPPPDPEVVREALLAEAAQAKAEAAAAGSADAARARLEQARAMLAPHRDADPAIARELAALEGLLAGSSAKEGVEQVSQQASGRGEYRQAPQVYRKSWTLVPPCPAEVVALVDEVQDALETAGLGRERANDAEQVLRELVDNAIEHGCRGQSAPRVDVEVVANRNHFQCIVADSGPGFDAAARIAEEERRPAHDPSARGRGLLLVKRLSDVLEHNAAGNSVRAMIRRERFRLEAEQLARIDSGGVEPVALVRVEGDLDAHTFADLEHRLDDLFDRQGVRRFIIDLVECRYISSTGVGVLVSFTPAVLDVGGRMVVVGSARVRETMEMLGLGDIIEFAASLEDARARLHI